MAPAKGWNQEQVSAAAPAACDPCLIYADLVGQEGFQPGNITRQLLDQPPAGYRFVTREKLTNRASNSLAHNRPYRWLRRHAQELVPFNLVANFALNRRHRPPAGCRLTYSASTVIFRPEPWLLFVENVTQLAGYHHHSLRRMRRVLQGRLGSSWCRGIICQSEAARNSFARHLDTSQFAEKLGVIYPAFSPAIRPGPARTGPPRILFVGGSTMSFAFDIKGGQEALEAFAVLRRQFPTAELILRSDVDPATRRRFSGLPGLRIIDRIIPASEVQALYESADIFWYPAHCMMSITMLEAMAYGLPVVTTRYFDNSEYVDHAATGIVIPAHRFIPPWDSSEREVRAALARHRDEDFVNALVQATAVLLRDPSQRRQMGAAARAKAERQFSLEEKNRRWGAILARAIGTGPAFPHREASA